MLGPWFRTLVANKFKRPVTRTTHGTECSDAGSGVARAFPGPEDANEEEILKKNERN